MSANILVTAADVWDYFLQHRKDLGNAMFLIAENEEYGVEIYLGSDYSYPEITVLADNVELYAQTVVNQNDCYLSCVEIYNKYLTYHAIEAICAAIENVSGKTKPQETKPVNSPDTIDGEYESDIPAGLDELEKIENREDELDIAVLNFIDTALKLDGECLEDYVGVKEASEIYEDVKEHFCEYLYRKFELPIYRPMYLTYKDGVKFEEYPYEKLEFDDPNNKVYKRNGSRKV